MNRSLKKVFFIKTLIIIFGCITLSIAVDFFFKSGIGGDAMTVFIDGMNKSFGLSEGWITILVNLLFVILIFLFDYKKIGIGTVIIVIGYGLIMNIVLEISVLKYTNNIIGSIAYCLVACILAAFSISLWIKIEFGYSPLEGFLVVLSQRTKISFTILKISMDILLLISGVFFGGNCSFGTLIAALLVGPLISLFMRLFKKIGFLK